MNPQYTNFATNDHGWLMRGFTDGVIRGLPRYQIMREFEKYYEDARVTEDDRVKLDIMLKERDEPAPEPEPFPEDLYAGEVVERHDNLDAALENESAIN